MAIRFLPYPLFQAFSDDGTPLEGGKVYVYAAGTTNAITTWADFNKNAANTHPVVLNSRGEAAIWFDAPAKIVLKDSNDVTIWTEDNIRPTTSQSLTGNYNLVENGSFELDGDGDGEPDSWTVQLYNASTSSQSLDTSEVAHGAQSIKFQSTGDGGGTATSTFFNVLGGGEHTVAFTIKSTVADVRNVVEVHWYDKSQTFLSKTAVYDDNTTNPTSFTRKYFNATAPANATFGKLVLIGCHESDSTSGSTWFDDVIVIKEGMFFSGATGEVTADASDLNNISGLSVDLSGLTATASELNKLDGYTGTTAELNDLDGYIGSTADFNAIAGSGSITVNFQYAFIFDGAVLLDSSVTTGSWTTEDISSLVDGKAVAAIVKMRLLGSNAGDNKRARAEAYLRRTGSALSRSAKTSIGRAQDAIGSNDGTVGAAAELTAEGTVRLDSQHRFDYYAEFANGSGNGSLYLVGYYIEP